VTVLLSGAFSAQLVSVEVAPLPSVYLIGVLMSYTRSRVVRLSLSVVTALVIMTAGVALRAQGDTGTGVGNPFDRIQAKLDQIMSIVSPVTPPSRVTLSTPPLSVAANEPIYCVMANVGSTIIAGTINISIIDDGGGVTEDSIVEMPAGLTYWRSRAFGGAAGFVRCSFSFDGTAAMVRANALTVTATGATIASADAR
jgi:hypothetical protein